MQLSVGLEVLTPQHQAIPIRSFWKDHHAILFFLRHLGCTACQQALRYLSQHYYQLSQRKVQVVPLAKAAPMNAEHLTRLLQLPFPIYSDSDQSVFEAFSPEPGLLHQNGGITFMQRGSDTPVFQFIPQAIFNTPPWEQLWQQLDRIAPLAS